jgi:hypothetical protein
VSGIAPAANLIPIKVSSFFDNYEFCQPSFSCVGVYTSDLIRALDYVLTLATTGSAGNIAAATVSLATPYQQYANTCDQQNSLFKQAVDNLRGVGIATIAAAGNRGSTTELAFPACVSSVISVGASTDDDKISFQSNRNSRLSLVAPGENIATFTSFGLEQSGTSLAAAHVAGAWALLKSRAPTASVSTILRALQQSAVQITDQPSGLTLPRIRIDRAALTLGTNNGAPTGVTVQVNGSTVTVTWGPPSDGSQPGYVVEILQTPGGQTVAFVNVGTSRSFATTLPNGTYAVRVRVVGGSASNDVPFQIGESVNINAPLSPRDLRITVFNNVVTLAWNMPDEGPAANGFIIDVGSAPSLSNYGSFDTGSNATSINAAPPSAGTYYVRIRARNAFGVSGPSNEEKLVISGGGSCNAVPVAPFGLRSTVVGSLVTLNWSPPVTGGVVGGYILEAGTAPGLSNVVQVPLGVTTTFSGIAVSGVYYVRVRAINSCGLSGPSNEIILLVP